MDHGNAEMPTALTEVLVYVLRVAPPLIREHTEGNWCRLSCKELWESLHHLPTESGVEIEPHHRPLEFPVGNPADRLPVLEHDALLYERARPRT